MALATFRSSAALTAEERMLVLRALHTPRGRYSSTRASQLSAVPRRTLDDWATSGALVPDWTHAAPRGWSYRDIVYSRLLAWLRSKGMERAKASSRVATEKALLASTEEIRRVIAQHEPSIVFLPSPRIESSNLRKATDQ